MPNLKIYSIKAGDLSMRIITDFFLVFLKKDGYFGQNYQICGQIRQTAGEFVRGVCSRVAEDVDPYNVEKLCESRVNSCAVFVLGSPRTSTPTTWRNWANQEMIIKSRFCIVYYNAENAPSTRKSGTKTALDYAVKLKKEIIYFPQ